MRRVFEVDVLLCSRCGGRRRVVAVYPEGRRLRDLLDRLGLSPPPRLPPPQAALLSTWPPDWQSALSIGAALLGAGALPRLLPAQHRPRTALNAPPPRGSAALTARPTPVRPGALGSQPESAPLSRGDPRCRLAPHR